MRLNRQNTSQQSYPFLHAGQTKPRFALHLLWIKSLTGISHGKKKGVFATQQRNTTLGGFGMLNNVPETFLDDTV